MTMYDTLFEQSVPLLALLALVLLIVVIAGLILGFQQRRHHHQAATLTQQNQQLHIQLATVEANLAHTAQLYDATQQQLQDLNQQYRAVERQNVMLKTDLARKQEHFEQQIQQFDASKAMLAAEFENLANRIFEEKSARFNSTSQTSIDSLLKPFKAQIDAFQKRLNDVHDASQQGHNQLQYELKKVLEIGLQMSREANNLSSALKGDSQQRGAWGEAQLRRTLEMSGLVETTHFEVQTAFKDEHGRSKQTDFLIKLPDNKHLVIDSKVTLVAYDRLVAATDPEQHELALKDHLQAVKAHIDDLAKKDYANLMGIHSPSFVLMFMPIEPAYIEALKHSNDLFDYGYKKGIVLVSHTTLIPILRTVSNLWVLEHSNLEAREISEKAGEIYNQVCVVAERLAKLGGTLETASKHYNATVTALAGQQGLHGKVERFGQLSAKVSKTLPALSPLHIDHQTERLDMITDSAVPTTNQ